jgi:hypothetical protein
MPIAIQQVQIRENILKTRYTGEDFNAEGTEVSQRTQRKKGK